MPKASQHSSIAIYRADVEFFPSIGSIKGYSPQISRLWKGALCIIFLSFLFYFCSELQFFCQCQYLNLQCRIFIVLLYIFGPRAVVFTVTVRIFIGGSNLNFLHLLIPGQWSSILMVAGTVSFEIHDEVAMAPANNAIRRK